jgi:RNA polymerase sigma-70 factor (ECF subfamily)
MKETPIDLLLKSNQGDQVAYESLLKWLNEHCHQQLKSGTSRYYNFPKEAFDDISQDVLLTFHTSHQTFDTSKPLLPWVNAIIRHKMIDFMRKKDFVVMMSGPDIEILKGSWIIEEELAQTDTADLSQLMESLGQQQYEILKLAKIEGYSSKEIAQELNLSDSNVKVSLHRTLKKLKKLAVSLNTKKR